MQVNGRNFLLPVDAQVASEQALRLEALDVDIVLEQVAAARTDVNLVILDACRNNPFERRFRSTSGGLAQIDAPKGTLIAYATAPGKVAADGEGGNGLYTAKLIEAIRTPGVQLEEVFKRVRIEVARASGDRQTPWEASSLVGSFYFFGPTTVTTAAAPPATVDREALHWQSVKDTNDPAQVQTYLDQYPSGAFAGLARARLAALQRTGAAAAPAAAGGTHPFDGTWNTVMHCERAHDGARGYTWRFPVVIKESRLAGEHRNPRNTGALKLSGVIAPNGSATLDALGTTGDEDFSVGRLRPGTNYTYTVSARFEGNQGSGRRNEIRACQFTFTRQ
jgi:hypothetical protein